MTEDVCLLPAELQLAVIQHLCLLHYPIVTIDPATGALYGVDAVLAAYSCLAAGTEEDAKENEKVISNKRCSVQ